MKGCLAQRKCWHSGSATQPLVTVPPLFDKTEYSLLWPLCSLAPECSWSPLALWTVPGSSILEIYGVTLRSLLTPDLSLQDFISTYLSNYHSSGYNSQTNISSPSLSQCSRNCLNRPPTCPALFSELYFFPHSTYHLQTYHVILQSLIFIVYFVSLCLSLSSPKIGFLFCLLQYLQHASLSNTVLTQ